MNGAQALVQTLLESGVDTCFANPGTSEMHFVAALDEAVGMRCVLCLFEGVATGAADGYARMAGKPAGTLLHLGPGMANGLANVHNAHRARTPMVNIVGDHATYHLELDAPLTSDIEGAARPFSDWVKTAPDAQSVAAMGAEAVAAARSAPGQIATLILPANTAWDPSPGVAPPRNPTSFAPVTDAQIASAAEVLASGEPCVLLLAGRALSQEGQLAASRIAGKTGAELIAQMSNARFERGAGCVALDRVPYPVDTALKRLSKYRHIILVGAKEPVAFFAYPGKPGRLAPENSQLHTLAMPEDDSVQALEALVDLVGARDVQPVVETLDPPPRPQGPLTPETLALAVAAVMPENAIVADESVSAGRDFFKSIRNVPRHTWLQITGGAIGCGLPLATGAAVACPDRKVLGLQADGSGMYTLQSLWTQAREGLDVTTVILANRAYAILQGEMRNVGATPGQKARDMLTLDRPDLDWVSLAKGMGVNGERVDTAEALCAAMERGLATPGPYLVEACLS